MSKPILLLIAYYFPPDSAIGGARPFRFYKYLSRLGYDCHVLTAAGVEGKGLEQNVTCIPDPSKTLRQGVLWQVERVGWKLLHGGSQGFVWAQDVIRAGRAFLEKNKGREVIILSSSPPSATHLVAWRLSKDFQCRWIADFRDPMYVPEMGRSRVANAILPILENIALNRADRVLANTDAVLKNWKARKTASIASKLRLVWNGFDAEDAIHPYSLPERKCKTWSHTGELYGGRDLTPLLEGVRRLLAKGKLKQGGLRILQVGYAEASSLPADASTQEWIELKEAVAATEARSYAMDSDGLLLIQQQTAVLVPAKLFEYLRLGRPILAYVVRDSPVEHILEQAGVPHVCIYPESTPEEIETLLLEFWGLMRLEPYTPSAWFHDTFEASRQAALLDSIMRDIAQEKGQRTVS